MTGHGADMIIVDDPLDAGKVSSPGELDRVNALFEGKLLSRLNSQATGIVLVVQQRLHTNDLSGFLRARGGFEHVVVPLIAEEPMQYQLGNGRTWDRAAGDVMDPEMYPLEAIESLQLNPAVFAAQYQQAPRPEGEALVRADWFGVYDTPPPTAQHTVFSIDTAMKAAGGSYSVILVFKTDGENHFLVDVWRDRVDYGQLEAKAVHLAKRYKPKIIVLEDAAFGGALKVVLEPFAPGRVKPMNPRRPKLERLQNVVDVLNAGRVHLPGYAVYKAPFLEEVCAFPGSQTDDQVDALSQYLQAMREIGPLWLTPKFIATGRPPKPLHPHRDPRNTHPNFVPRGRGPGRR